MSEKLQPYSCSKLEVFWKEVFKASAKKNITRSEGDVLGLMPKSIDRKVKKKYCLQILLTAAIKCITLKWSKPDPPNIQYLD